MTWMWSRRCTTRILFVMVWALPLFDVQGAVTYQTRALTGDAAPDTIAGVVYSNLFVPVINEAGQTAFKGTVTGPDVDSTNNIGFWSEGAGSLGLVARAGDAAPGTEPGVKYRDFISPVLNGSGRVAFQAMLTGPGVDLVSGTNDRGIWSEGSGSLGLVAREGDAAAGTEPGVVYSFIGAPAFNDAGQTAFQSSVVGSGVGQGIWSGSSGLPMLVARSGDAAPGAIPGRVFSGLTSPALNGTGQTAFISGLTYPGMDGYGPFEQGIWLGDSGSLGLVALTGAAAPGTEPGTLFSDFSGNVINGGGQVTFMGTLTGPGVNGTNHSGIWSGDPGSLGLVARTGDSAPGTVSGVTYSTFIDDSVVINGAGQTAFLGIVTGPGVDNTNDRGIWLEGSGSLDLFAREGDVAPGTELGVLFSGFDFSNKPVLNAVGQAAFLGSLTGPGVDNTNNRGIWATDTNGVLTLVARTGDLFDVNDDPLIDDLRTISLVSLIVNSGGQDGRPTSFNNAGQLALRIEFSDATAGIFVAIIPEPGTMVLVSVGLVVLMRSRGAC